MMTNRSKTPFQVYLPEDVGIIDNIYAHIQIQEEKLDIKAFHSGRYISSAGCEWLKVFYTDGKIFKSNKLESSSFSFYVNIWNGIEGTFYLTFSGWKNEILTSYYTEQKHFSKNHKLIIW